MNPTARIDAPRRRRESPTGPERSGLGDPWWRPRSDEGDSGTASEGTYELWHYHATEKARKRVLSETKVTVADDYIFIAPDYCDSIAEKTVDVVNSEGGSARVEQRTFDDWLKGTYKVAVVESRTKRETVESFIDQIISEAKRGDYDGGPLDAAVEIVFEEVRASKDRPDLELLSQNEFNPRPGYYYNRNRPCIEWKKVFEGNGGGGNGGSGGPSTPNFPINGGVVSPPGGNRQIVAGMSNGSVLVLGVSALAATTILLAGT
jgi:hypothetical protein